MRKIIALSIALLFTVANCYAGNDSMPNVPEIPLKPGLSYGGFFKNHQPVKILFSVGQPGPQLKESLINGALV